MSFIDNVISILTADWNSANTDSVTPKFRAEDKVKRLAAESILVYDIALSPKDNASGGKSKMKDRTVALSVRSFKNYDRSELYVAEVERILNAPGRQVNPFGDWTFDIQNIIDIQNDRSKTRGYYAIKILVKFEQFNKVYT